MTKRLPNAVNAKCVFIFWVNHTNMHWTPDIIRMESRTQPTNKFTMRTQMNEPEYMGQRKRSIIENAHDAEATKNPWKWEMPPSTIQAKIVIQWKQGRGICLKNPVNALSGSLNVCANMRYSVAFVQRAASVCMEPENNRSSRSKSYAEESNQWYLKRRKKEKRRKEWNFAIKSVICVWSRLKNQTSCMNSLFRVLRTVSVQLRTLHKNIWFMRNSYVYLRCNSWRERKKERR